MSSSVSIGGDDVSFTAHSARLTEKDLPNTLQGIRACVEAGVSRIEIDVHSIDGGDYLVSHANRLEEATTSTGPVGRLILDDARVLRRSDSSAQRPPLLSEVIALMSGSTTELQLDLKDWRPLTEGRTRVLVSLAEGMGNRVIVSSGQDWNLQALAARDSSLRLGFDPDHYIAAGSRDVPIPARVGAYGYRDDHPLALGRAQSVRDYWRNRVADLVAKCPSVEEFFIEYRLVLQALDDGVSIAELLHEQDISVSAWTIDYSGSASLQVVSTLVEAGVDRITTNTSHQFLAALRT